MPTFTVRNTTRGTVLADRASEARTFATRLLGWMGRSHIPPGDGLHIVPCGSVHTFFMRVPIDVLMLDAEHRVVRLFPRLRPWRATPPLLAARSVLELPAGTAEASSTREGDVLALSPNG